MRKRDKLQAKNKWVRIKNLLEKALDEASKLCAYCRNYSCEDCPVHKPCTNDLFSFDSNLRKTIEKSHAVIRYIDRDILESAKKKTKEKS